MSPATQVDPSAKAGETERRLLEAAGAVFAEKGFSHATVREICGKAKANVAAVSYHFRDKDGLYQAVIRYAFDRAMEKYPPNLGLPESATPEKRLHAFIHSLMLRCLGPGQPAWHGKLMLRELTEPTGFLDQFASQAIRPNFERLQGIVRSLARRKLTDEEARFCAMSIVGQAHHYRLVQPVIRRLMPQMKYSEDDIARAAAHITRFSIAAIRHLERGHLDRGGSR